MNEELINSKLDTIIETLAEHSRMHVSHMEEFKMNREEFKMNRAEFKMNREEFKMNRAEFKMNREEFKSNRAEFKSIREEFKLIKDQLKNQDRELASLATRFELFLDNDFQAVKEGVSMMLERFDGTEELRARLETVQSKSDTTYSALKNHVADKVVHNQRH